MNLWLLFYFTYISLFARYNTPRLHGRAASFAYDQPFQRGGEHLFASLYPKAFDMSFVILSNSSVI